MEKNLELLYQGALADGTLLKSEIEVLLKRAEATGEDMDAFKRNLLNDYIEIVLKKENPAEAKKKVLDVVKILDEDKMEYSMLLDARISQMNPNTERDGQIFIQNLKKEIANVAIYTPTGKYGKNEFSGSKTAAKKADLFLSASPQSPSEIYEYVAYASSLGFNKNKKARQKIKSLLNEANKKYPYDSQIKYAQKIAHKDFLKYYLHRIYRVALPIVFLIIYIGFFWLDIHWGWKVLWGILAFSPFVILIMNTIDKAKESSKNYDVSTSSLFKG